MPLSLVALTRVRDQDSGLASSLLNTGQQVGGAIGLAALGTVAWTAVANSTRSQIAAAAAGSGHSRASAQAQSSIYHHALAAGITRGFLAASGIALAALITTAVTIRISREDLTARRRPHPGRNSTMNTQNRATVTPVQIHADHAAQKWLGNWTTDRAFQIRARHAQVTIDLRSPQIPAGDIEIGLSWTTRRSSSWWPATPSSTTGTSPGPAAAKSSRPTATRPARPPDPPDRTGPSRRGPGSQRPDRPLQAIAARDYRRPAPPSPLPPHTQHPKENEMNTAGPPKGHHQRPPR